MRIGRALRSVATSDRAAVIRPMQECLPLTPPALEVSFLAMLPNGRNVPRDRTPPPYLSRIVPRPAPHVIAAVPLKPAARILRIDPAFAAPLGE